MEDSAVFIISLITLGFFLLTFGIVYMNKRENLAMIEKGMNPKDPPNRPVTNRSLKWGLLLVGGGIGLLVAYFINIYVTKDENPALWFALLAIGGGAGLVRYYSIEKGELSDKPELKETRVQQEEEMLR
jgi:hypothetical protein